MLKNQYTNTALNTLKILEAINVAVILPALNESLTIKQTVREFIKYFPTAQIIVIDNNSSDDTAKIALEELRPTDHLLFQPIKGKAKAVEMGLARVKADVYILCDADYTYSAQCALELAKEMIVSRADMVVGNRISSGAFNAQNQRAGHHIGNSFFSRLISLFTGQRLMDIFSGLRVLSSPLVDCTSIDTETFEVETELTMKASALRATVRELPIQYRSRPEGSSSKLNTIRDGLKILLYSGLTLVRNQPLKAFFTLSFIFFSTSILLASKVLVDFVENGWTSPATVAVSATLLLAGLLSTTTGLAIYYTTSSLDKINQLAFADKKRKWNKALDAACV